MVCVKLINNVCHLREAVTLLARELEVEDGYFLQGLRVNRKKT